MWIHMSQCVIFNWFALGSLETRNHYAWRVGDFVNHFYWFRFTRMTHFAFHFIDGTCDKCGWKWADTSNRVVKKTIESDSPKDCTVIYFIIIDHLFSMRSPSSSFSWEIFRGAPTEKINIINFHEALFMQPIKYFVSVPSECLTKNKLRGVFEIKGNVSAICDAKTTIVRVQSKCYRLAFQILFIAWLRSYSEYTVCTSSFVVVDQTWLKPKKQHNGHSHSSIFCECIAALMSGSVFFHC